MHNNIFVRVQRSTLVLVACGVVAATPGLATTPDLTLTESTYQDCLSQAADPAAQITVVQDQVTLVGPTSSLSAVYAALAGVQTDQGLSVSSNAAGTQALSAAQSCLARRVPTVGAGRLHQVRADLRCGDDLFVDDQTVFSSFEVIDGEWATFFPDGVQNPVCGDKRHREIYELSNGDFAAAWVEGISGNQRKNDYTMSCANAACSSTAGNQCNPGRLTGPMGKQPGCLCTGTGDGYGCKGSSSSTTEDESTSCPASLF